MSNILLNESDNVLEVILDRPEKHHAISDDMLEQLRAAVNLFGARRDLRVLLISSSGGRYFTAGMDVNPELSPDVGNSTLDGRHWYRTKYHLLFDELESIEKPVVAAHRGICLGGGLEMSLSCDFRLAASSARYGLPEIEIGALPGSGGISRLTRVAGPHWARWLVMAGEQIDAQQALQIGIVHAVYADDEFDQCVKAFCTRLARRPYELLGLAKLSIELATDLDRAQARNVERISNSILFTGAEHKAMLQAFIDRQAQRRRTRDSEKPAK